MIRLKPNIVFDYNTGETFVINDDTGPYDATLNPTGYGTPNIAASAIHATRFIFSSYIKEQQATNSTSIVSGVEYTAIGSGSFTFDTKTYSAGETFICYTSGTPTLPSTIKLRETGRFCSVTTFLPASIVTSNFTPSLLGISDTIFPDSIYSVQYDVFTTSHTAGAGIPAGTYIVYGTTGDTVTISGVTYRIGEVFTQGSTFTFTGSASIALFYATTVDANGAPDYVYFLCGYWAFQALILMQNRLANSFCSCSDKIRANLVDAWNAWMAIIDQLQVVDGTIDISGAQILLEQIVELSTQCKC